MSFRKKLLLNVIFFSICLFVNGQEKINPSLTDTQDYAKYNLNKTSIPEKWEDGMRTSGEKGNYEWWYYDAHLEDGSTVVVVFASKNISKINKPLKPMILLSIDRPNGVSIQKEIISKGNEFSASKDSCNVEIGGNYFRGNLKEYEIHYEDDELNFNATLTRKTDSWRPSTGHLVTTGEKKESFFGWVVPVPEGDTKISYTYKDQSKVELAGSAYHDHNWGNESLTNLINHWYWARAKVGPYNIIAAEMISDKKYNSSSNTIFYVSKDGKTIAENGYALSLYKTQGKMHSNLNKDISDNLLFIYDDTEEEYRYEFYLNKKKILIEKDLLESVVGKGLTYFLARKLTGFDGAYFRFTGDAELKVFKNNTLLESHTSSSAVWELMYLGKPLK